MKPAFLDCLERLDIRQAWGLWGAAFPHLPPPENDDGMLIMLHMARTQSPALSLRQRAYSHAWLRERGYPSQLPDHLRQPAERLYPIIASGVGISVNFKSSDLKPAAELIRGAMEGAVYEAEADGKLNDSDHVKARMTEAREKETRALFGRWSPSK